MFKLFVNGWLGSLVGVVALGVTLSGCQAPQSEEGPSEVAEEVATPGAPNTLTEAEQAEGWQLLFDGKSMDQWRGFKMDEIPPGWVIEGETLQFSGERGGEGSGDLMTKEQYANFELKLEWKISPGGNSGILYRVTENYDQEFHTGPEVQILDNSKEHYPGLEDTQLAGANYALHPPSKDVVKPVGEWNSMHLVVNGAQVEHWLNGEKIVAFELWTDEWKDLVAKSKFVEWPDYGLNKTGHLVLQDHGAGVWFRNIKLKVLN